MSNQEILDQIAKFEKGLSNPNIPESTKNTIKSKIDGLKAQLEKVEEKVEKKEEKLQAEEKKIQSELEENIVKWEKGLNNPNIPASAKEAIKKKIAAAKEEVSKQKAEIKEDVKEADKEKKEVKAAVKKLAEVAKKAGKVKGKKIPKVVVKEEQREKKSEKRQSKLKGMMDELQALIHKNKFLASKYEGKGVDLKRDAARPAKPFGYRFTGKDNYAVPTKEQIKKGLKDGSVDYEGRANRSDKTPKKEYKLAHGGDVDGNQNAEMVLSKAKELHHHATELENVVKPNSDVEAWEVAKMERASTDASDVTHYEDGKKMYMAKGGKVELIFHGSSREIPMGEFESASAAKKYVQESDWERPYSIKKIGSKKMAKGGNVEGKAGSKFKIEMWDSFDDMIEDKKPSRIVYSESENELRELGEDNRSSKLYMKRKGKYLNITTFLEKGGELEKYVVEKDKDGSYRILNTEKGMYVDQTFKTKSSAESWKKEKDLQRERFGMESYFAKGGKIESKKAKKRLEQLRKELRAGKISYGELAELQDLAQYIEKDDVELLEAAGVPEFEDDYKKGGKLSSKAKYIPKRDIEEVEIDKNGKEVQIDGADLLDGIYVKKSSYTKKKSAGRPAKKATGGEVKPKSNRKGGKSVGQIAALAKQIRKEGEKWTDAIKRASAQLKSKI